MDIQNNKTLWNDVLESVKLSVSTPTFNTWFSQTHLINLNKKGDRPVAEVGCNSVFVRDTIETRYFSLIQDILSTSLGETCDVIFVIKQAENIKTQTENSSPLFENSKTEAITNEAKSVGLRPGFIFDNFAVSSTNQMAHAAAEAVAQDLGQAYNPLFIWGGVGVGKTHLMHAVGFEALEKNQDLKIFCCTGEKFTNDIVEGIRNKSTPQVRQRYRKLDALLIDDIQFIAGKDTVQEEFFHTFNDLVSAGSQVILTSDRPPSEISKLEARLISRFEAGLIVDIAVPDFELRCAITSIKAHERGIELPMDIIQVIAGNIETARKIEGFLVKLSSEAKIKAKEITPDLVESLLSHGVEPTVKSLKANPGDVISAVSKYYSLGKRVLLGNSRARPIARPRQILMYLLRMDLRMPLEQVGELVGGRDHTTVMHAVDKITHLASMDVNTREDIRGIKNIL